MISLDLENMLVCRSILSNELVQELMAASAQQDDLGLSHAFAGHLIEQAENEGWSGNLIRALFLHLLSQEGCLAAKMAEASKGQIGLSLKRAFIHDIKKLMPALFSPATSIINISILDNYEPSIPHTLEATQFLNKQLQGCTTPEAVTDAFLCFYQKYGYGEIASYQAFSWDSKHQKLHGIRHFEAMDFEDIIGYKRQKEQLINNTMAFINKKPANNVLLVGARGTGKSSGVKALAKAYYTEGLRLLQMQKSQLSELPKIMSVLRQYASKRFIIFFDDLSFEESDSNYKYLKSAIEGGVESCPENVLIYATPNRRHLIRETWRDRTDEQDELFRNDSINETISLSDRFGIIITYLEPTQAEYLDIIDHFLQQEGVHLDREELRILGHRWNLEHSGRSGRSARQFVTHYLGQLK
ncbi:MAG: ATP-binding protein [Anaerovibrio sp.]|uniref:ATP-binding protein n=1 Tax=Anaerovibrio sp. TaxID=1872532 RepID=UPI0025CC8571|nr:ATP-binding protein [Anaerovibrio sp.]MCR5177277.1 ATP-binding protein [Anaerovibrio sp.]